MSNVIPIRPIVNKIEYVSDEDFNMWFDNIDSFVAKVASWTIAPPKFEHTKLLTLVPNASQP